MYIGSNSVLFCSCRTRLHISSLMMRKKQSSISAEGTTGSDLYVKENLHTSTIYSFVPFKTHHYIYEFANDELKKQKQYECQKRAAKFFSLW